MEQQALKKMLEPIGKSVHKSALEMMLQAISSGLTFVEGLLVVHHEDNLAAILNSINGIALSLRFQKDFKYMENQKEVSVLSKQFNENSKKMRHFRKIGVEKLCNCLEVE
jgi:hypothetical protein